MKHLLSATALLVCLAAAARAADDENPFRKAKVGDWVEYQMVTSAGIESVAKIKQTLIAKDEKEATIEIPGKASFMGKEVDVPTKKEKIDLTKPYDIFNSPDLHTQGLDAKIEKGDGKEKVKAGGKEYECILLKSKATGKLGGQDVDEESKMWISKDVPFRGVVKMDMKRTLKREGKSMMHTITMELTSFGSK